uniref:Uncharacterized protein n=1 Tax=Ciona savignyi TaxID=51511 RepID=H2ZH41_CIOSA
KSPNRSGKSTPTRGRAGAEKKDEEKLLQEEEEARIKLEQEEKERQEREVIWMKYGALKLFQYNCDIVFIKHIVSFPIYTSLILQWNRYMRCDGKPDPTSVKEINTFISLLKETGSPDTNVVLEDAQLILSLIKELNQLLEDYSPEEFAEKSENYKQTILSLQDLLLNRYDEATLKILKEASYEADSESGNLQKTVSGDNETIMLWANLNKNPRFKFFEFEEDKITFELPKVLAMADIAVRILRTKFDHYSHQCSSFQPKIKKPKEEVITPFSIPEPELPVETSVEDKVETGSHKEEDEDTTSVTDEGRKSVENDPAKEEEKTDETKNAENEGNESTNPSEIKVTVDEDELDDILDPDVVDLRQFSPLGGVFHVDLVKTPPQPNVVRGWTLTQILDKPLTAVKYPSDNPNVGKSASRQPPIGLTFTLPQDVMFFEEPQVAKWDPTDKHWKTSGITDTNYDEENRKLSLKTQEFGIFSLMQDSHLNMPFQSWELKPKGNSVVLTITAAIAEVAIEVKGTECRLVAPAEDPPTELSGLYGKWMSPAELILSMQKSGVNVFPATDSHKFVSIQSKVDMDRIYEQMAVLSSNFAFSWSKWNNDAGSEKVILQVCESGYLCQQLVLSDDDFSIFYVADEIAYKLALSEYDGNFSDTIASGASYQCDLLHAARLTPLPGDSDGQQLAKLEEKSQNANKFFIHTVATLLKASRVLSFS